jgi:hypothetical protein
MICEKCGHELQIGEWPFCPHEYAVGFGEEPLDYWDENLLPDPVHITSRTQRRKIMDAHGLDYRKKFEAPPGFRRYVDLGRK